MCESHKHLGTKVDSDGSFESSDSGLLLPSLQFTEKQSNDSKGIIASGVSGLKKILLFG